MGVFLETQWLTDALTGNVIVAMPIAFFAGIVTFFSPCVLPLIPAYLSYASGFSVQEIMHDGVESSRQKTRMLLASALFVLGFAVVFVLTGAMLGGIGAVLKTHARVVEIGAGVLAVLLGLIFADLIPLGQTDKRFTRVRVVGLSSAPVLGAAFGVGWTPCIGPTLGIVLTLAMTEGTPGKGALLAFVYALGIGIPFIVAGLAFQEFNLRVGWVKRHQLGLKRAGGAVMVMMGVLMVTGLWDWLMELLESWISGFAAPM